jgi:hypothetical protein
VILLSPTAASTISLFGVQRKDSPAVGVLHFRCSWHWGSLMLSKLSIRQQAE